MKKKMLIILAAISALLFSACSDLSEKSDYNKNDYGEVKISLGTAARTITSISDWDVGEVESWTFTFASNEGKIEKVIANDAAERFLQIPVGDYTVTAEGSASAYTLYGTAENIKIRKDETSEVVIYVGLKKTEGGKGTDFEYTLKLKNERLIESFVGKDLINNTDVKITTIGDYSFSAFLTSVKNAEKTVELSITGETVENAINLTVTGESIPSGFYYLTVMYEYDNFNYAVPLQDTLVEIADGMETTGSYDNTTFEGYVTRNFYVSNDDTSYNGITPAYKKNFNSTIQWLKDHSGAWTKANLYFSARDTETENIKDVIKAVTPTYDVSVNPTYEGSLDKTVTVYVGEEDIFSFVDGKIVLGSAPEITLCLYSDEPSDVEVYYSLGEEGISHENITIYQDETNVIFNNVFELPEITSYVNNATAYTQDSTPYLTFNFAEERDEISTNNLNLIYVKEDGTLDLNTYAILPKWVDEDTLELYTALAGQSGMEIEGAIPAFGVVCDKTTAYELDDETPVITAVPQEGSEFYEGSTFTWFLNGYEIEDETESSITLNLKESMYVVLGNNVIQCTVKKDEYFSSGYAEFEVKNFVFEGRALLFNSVLSTKWTTEDSTEDNVIISDTANELLSYCYDKYGNLYVSLKNTTSNNYSIAKYTYNKNTDKYPSDPVTLWTVESTDESTYQFGSAVRMASDGKHVYFKRAKIDYTTALKFECYSPSVETAAIDDNYIYYISADADNLSSTLSSINISSDFNKVTSLAITKNGKLYVGGSKDAGTTTKKSVKANGAQEEKTIYYSRYFVNSYSINDDGSVDLSTMSEYISYTDEEIVNEYQLNNILTTETAATEDEPWSDRIVEFGCVVSDIVAERNNVYVLMSYQAINSYSSYGTEGGTLNGLSQDWQVGGIFITNASDTVRLYGQATYNAIGLGGTPTEDEQLQAPSRILAIKPKDRKAILANASGAYTADTPLALHNIIDLDEGTVTFSGYKYGYKFDSCLDASGTNISFTGSHTVDYINCDLESATRQQ